MKVIKSLFFSLLILLLLALPEWLYYFFFNPSYISVAGGKYYLSVTLFALTLGFVEQKKAIYLSIGLYYLMQATQLMHFQYYGSFYGYSEVNLLAHEMEDAVSGFLDAWKFLMPACLASLLSLILMSAIYNLFSKGRATAKYNYLLPLLIFIIPSIQLFFSATAAQKSQPIASHSAFRNSLFAFSGVVANLNKANTYTKYEEYKIHNVEAIDANIVVVMGESLSLKHMASFGYERGTTPFLASISNKENVLMLPAISSAVTTRSSLALFFNQVYEPNNIKNLQSMQFSLFKLAKKNGRKTYYFTTQNNAKSLGSSFSLPDIDVWKDTSDLPPEWGKYDDRLVKQLPLSLQEQESNGFVVLHMRSAHAPYIDNYPTEFEKFRTRGEDHHNYMRNSYDNSVLYVDYVLQEIVHYFNESQVPTIIVFTADHGELMGENGRYGHNQLGIDVSTVPFILMGLNIEKETFASLRKEFGCITNHYNISKFVSRLIGFDVKNPNEIESQFYINGQSPYGNAGFLEYQIDEDSCFARANVSQ